MLKSLLQSLLIRGQEVSDSSTRSPITLVLSPLGGGGISQKPSGDSSYSLLVKLGHVGSLSC